MSSHLNVQSPTVKSTIAATAPAVNVPRVQWSSRTGRDKDPCCRTVGSSTICHATRAAARILEPETYKQRLQDLFNTRADTYDSGDAHPPLAAQLVHLADFRSGERCLDLATGTGLVALQAAPLVSPQGSVLGLDLSAAMLERAKHKAHELGLRNVTFIQGDIEEVELGAGSFDVITCSSAMIYLQDIPTALRKLRSWLKPGGRLVFNTPQEPCVRAAAIFYALVAEHFDVHLADAATPLSTSQHVQDTLQEAGFSAVQVTTSEEVIVSPDTSPEVYSQQRWRTMSGAGSVLTPINRALTADQIQQLEAPYLTATAELAKSMQTERGIENPYTMLWVVAVC